LASANFFGLLPHADLIRRPLVQLLGVARSTELDFAAGLWVVPGPPDGGQSRQGAPAASLPLTPSMLAVLIETAAL